MLVSPGALGKILTPGPSYSEASLRGEGGELRRLRFSCTSPRACEGHRGFGSAGSESEFSHNKETGKEVIFPNLSERMIEILPNWTTNGQDHQ